MKYYVFNDKKDPIRQLSSTNLNDAVAEAQRLIDIDGAYWDDDKFRSVRSEDQSEIAELQS